MIQTLSDALSERGYETLTPVQEAVTEPGLDAADLLVSAQTGSGKTVAFGLAIAPTLLGEDGRFGPAGAPVALIVAPTRELAFQVQRELQWLYAKAGTRVVSCVGGMDMRDERRALDRGCHVVVGTPGRLVDHIRRGSLDMGSLRAVVLDEADEMLDLGFREDLEFMLGEAPVERRTLMFSATVPPMIATLAKHYQRNAVRIETQAKGGQHADIEYLALRVAPQDTETAIVNVLRYHDAQNAIVFANTRATVARLTTRLSNRGFAVVSLSGELSQSERTNALAAMRDGRARVCVATDVAARGIDLPKLDLVIHAELPSNAEGLLHRSGRTGRAGRKGISALIVPPKMGKRAERLLNFAKIGASWDTAPSADEVLERDEMRLLADPAWTDEPSDAEASFAAKVLDRYSPEQVAAAYLRLFRQRNSAPEELSDPDARAPVKERTPFGPSAWVTLSVGRDERAEPRWLLPLLCRAGGLDKDQIGAIRVQQSETFVEVKEAALPILMGNLGEGGALEKDVSVRPAGGPPGEGRLVPAKASRAAEVPARSATKPQPGPKPSTPGPAPRPAPEPRLADEPGAVTPRPKRGGTDADRSEYKSRWSKPSASGGGAAVDRDRKKPQPSADPTGIQGPSGEAKRDAHAPKANRSGKSSAPRRDGKPGGPKTSTKPGGSKSGGKSGGSKSGKPGDTKAGGSPGGANAGAKPNGKFAGPKPGGKAKPSRAPASDTSKRFTPPGGAKGGDRPPKRRG